MRISGRRYSCAIASHWMNLRCSAASAAPPRTVKSSADATTGRPSILARPKMKLLAATSISAPFRSEEYTSELQSLMRISYAVFCLKKKKKRTTQANTDQQHIQYDSQQRRLTTHT